MIRNVISKLKISYPQHILYLQENWMDDLCYLLFGKQYHMQRAVLGFILIEIGDIIGSSIFIPQLQCDLNLICRQFIDRAAQNFHQQFEHASTNYLHQLK